MRVIAIGGQPATGKSTVLKALIEALPVAHGFIFNRVKGLHIPEKSLYILGVYNDREQKFPGTDRLSMSCQPDATEFLRRHSGQKTTILFEGDRLVNQSFINQCIRFAQEVKVYMLWAPDTQLAERHKARHDTQSQTFLEGRTTKAKNILSAYQELAQQIVHTKPDDTETLVFKLIDDINKKHD